MRRVFLIEAQIKQYRLPFYEQLFSILEADDIELKVGYSDPSKVEASTNDNCDLPPDYGVKVPAYWLAGERLLFQPLLRPAMTADMVILEQGNKFLLNCLLLPISRVRQRRMAFWGMGANRQAATGSLPERFRRLTTSWVSWWFAYTAGTAEYVANLGFPAERITNVSNSTDSRAFRALVAEIGESEKLRLRAELGIGREDPVAVFCGRLRPTKNLPFLLQAARLIKQRCPRVHLIVIGAGSTKFEPAEGNGEASWIHFMGAKFGRDKAALFSLSDIMLMPGAVGLVIVDAFAAGLPLLSTRLAIHGPEIDYLEENSNGLLCEPNVAAFADMTASLLLDRDRLARLQAGARAAGSRYTIENMAERFRTGIHACLESAPDAAAVTA